MVAGDAEAVPEGAAVVAIVGESTTQDGPHRLGRPGQPRLRSTSLSSAATQQGRLVTSAQL